MIARAHYKIASAACMCLTMAVLAIFVIYGDILSDDPNTLLITEVCGKNDITAHDELGNYGADYIELYNGTDDIIKLGGYGLSDSKTDLYQFTFPDVDLAPHAFMVVWNDEIEQDLSSYVEGYVVKDIHGMTFAISSQGENIYLTNPSGRIIDEISVAADIPDGYSYQTALEDPDDYVIGEPTLYAVAEHFDEIVEPGSDVAKLDAPTFSVDGGWYDDPITVELSCAEGNIYYTLDGSEPDENSERYEQPIVVTNRSNEPNVWSAIETVAVDAYVPTEPVDKCTVIKAIAINGDTHSDVAIQSYFVGLDNTVYENMAILSLAMDPEDLFGYENGIYVLGVVSDTHIAMTGEYEKSYDNFSMRGRGWERKAQMEFYSSDHELKLQQDIGVRVRGHGSSKYNQKSLSLYARIEYDGNDAFQYAFFGKEYNRLSLRNGGSPDVTYTKIRDVFVQSLVSDRNIGCQQAVPCIVFLNGEYWGLYNLQEQVCESYVENYYGIGADNVIIVNNPWETEEDPNTQAYMEIVDYAESHDLSEDSNYAWMEERIDIQSYIDYYCTEIYVANYDAFGNNYAMWRSKEVVDSEFGDGRWRWLLYDMDSAADMNQEISRVDTDSFISGHLQHDPLGENGDTLFSALMQNDTFKEQFVTTFLDMADTNFAYERVHEVLYDMAEEYCDAVVASHQRFGVKAIIDDGSGRESVMYTEQDYWNLIQVIDDFFRERRDYIVRYMYRDLGVDCD